MDKLLCDNTITLSNLYETISNVLTQVGYEYQAPLEAAEEQEVISHQIKAAVLTEE